MKSRLLLAFNVLVIGLIGLLYLCEPNLLLARYGLETETAGMDNMLRSAYGGIFLVSALIFATEIVLQARRRDALAFLTLFAGTRSTLKLPRGRSRFQMPCWL
ncbi:MAG: DUF4345 family protein [Pseudomonadota bacterium]